MEEVEEEDLVIETNHVFTPDGMPIFFIKDEDYAESSDILKDEDYILANDVVLEVEPNDYQHDFMNYLSGHHRKYPLRSRDVPISPIQKRKDVQSKNDSSKNQKKGKELADQNPRKLNEPSTSKTAKEKDNQKKDSAGKEQTVKRDISVKEVEKVSYFNLESDIAKLKVSIPLTELVKNRNLTNIMCPKYCKLILFPTW